MKKFKKIYIEITNTCNLSCDFCPKTLRKAEFMSRELFGQILEKVKGHSEFLYFHVMGEPLLHPEIGSFLDLCSSYGYRVNITTNGTLIRRVQEAIIAKLALRQMNFSLHSFEANSKETSMDSYLDGIFEFIRKAGNERKLYISLRLWNISEQGSNRENRYILNRIQKEFGLPFAIEDKIPHCRGIKLAENIFLNQAEKFDWPDVNAKEVGIEGFCYGMRDQLAILVDGTVVPCCLDRDASIYLGNIKEGSIQEIVESKRAKELFDGFSRREAVEDLCRRCGYRSRFK